MNVRYDYPEAEAFFSSPKKRCLETLKIFYPSSVPIIIPEFAECNFGDFEGKMPEELQGDPQFDKWIKSGGATAPPNGESGADFASRTCAAFEGMVEALLKTDVSSAVICLHGGSIMTIFAQYAMPQAELGKWLCDPGTGFTVRLNDYYWRRGQVIEVIAPLPSGYYEDKAKFKR